MLFIRFVWVILDTFFKDFMLWHKSCIHGNSKDNEVSFAKAGLNWRITMVRLVKLQCVEKRWRFFAQTAFVRAVSHQNILYQSLLGVAVPCCFVNQPLSGLWRVKYHSRTCRCSHATVSLWKSSITQEVGHATALFVKQRLFAAFGRAVSSKDVFSRGCFSAKQLLS